MSRGCPSRFLKHRRITRPKFSELPGGGTVSEKYAWGAGVFDRCDPESADFHERALSCILVRSARLRESGMWSLMELGLNGNDFEKLRRWGKKSAVDFRDLARRPLRCGPMSVSGIEAIALTCLACCCEIGRNAGTEGELWPIVYDGIGHSLRKQVFANYAYPKPRVRDATESICSRLNIRHVFGREGEQSWLATNIYFIFSTLWNFVSHWGSTRGAPAKRLQMGQQIAQPFSRTALDPQNDVRTYRHIIHGHPDHGATMIHPLGTHIFPVNVPDAVSKAPDKLQRITATQPAIPGVETNADRVPMPERLL